MTGRYLLDTNIVIAVLKGERAVVQRLEEEPEVFVSSITLGELYFGVYKSAKVADNMVAIQRIASTIAILGCDGEAAKHYGQLKNHLRGLGKPIPENDIWIAAIARRNSLAVATRDTDFDFFQVTDLEIRRW